MLFGTSHTGLDLCCHLRFASDFVLPLVCLQKSVAKLNGHIEEVQAAIDHEADKLKEFEADQTALKDR
jgi:hypothetical protein